MSEHAAENAKGKVKEAVGDLTGDKDLQREGKVDQASAATKKKLDEAGAATKKAVDDVAKKASDVLNPKK